MKSFFIGNREITLPIIQGGMGVGVSLSGLASAVANEGGVGIISSAGLGLIYNRSAYDYISNSIWGLKEEIRKVRAKTYGVIGVNIMMALSNFSDMAKTAIAEKVDIIFSGAGLPLDLPSYLTDECNTQLVPIVSSARAAKIICDKWQNNYNYLPDAIVVEGPKAGGHLGYKVENLNDENYSLEKTLPEVLDVVSKYRDYKNIPVIAAGGISCGEDILRYIKMGVSAVQMGSIFVPTEECDAADGFKQQYINSEQKDIVIIKSPVGMPGRAINGSFLESVERGEKIPKCCTYRCIKTCNYKTSPYCIIKALYSASLGDMENGYAFAGALAYKTTKIRSVKEVINTLKAEYDVAEIE